MLVLIPCTLARARARLLTHSLSMHPSVFHCCLFAGYPLPRSVGFFFVSFSFDRRFPPLEHDMPFYLLHGIRFDVYVTFLFLFRRPCGQTMYCMYGSV